MKRVEAKDKVRSFLASFIPKFEVWGIFFIDRVKNDEAMAALGITPAQREDIIRGIEVDDYIETIADTVPFGDFWVFGREMTKEYVDIESPFTGGKVFEVHDVEEKTFRGEKFIVNVRYYLCEDTGEMFTSTEQDELWTNELYGQYRSKHGIPSPAEIKAIRESFGLNYAQMSRMLGFGINQLRNYENGQVPSESNGKMLRIITNPLTMMNLLEISINEFQASEYERVRGKIALRYFEQVRKRDFSPV